MKLYHFNPNGYGLEFFVMSNSKENAIKSLNEHLIKEFESNPLNCPGDGDEPLQWGDDYFKERKFNDIVLEKGYTIDVYEANQVIESEIA